MLKRILLTLSLLISACNFSQNTLKGKEAEVQNYKKHLIRVDDIQIIDNYSPPFHKPNMEHLMRNSPGFMIKKWIDKHLISMGDRDILRITIDNSRLVEKINKDQYEYEINIDFTLSLIENTALPSIKITKNILINKIRNSKTSKNLNKDKEFFHQMIKELIEELSVKIEQVLNADFYTVIIS